MDVLTDYAAALQPLVGDKSNCDEMKVKYGGDWEWPWHFIDRQTHYHLVSHVTEARELADACSVFAGARNRVGRKPAEIVTDGLASYIEARKQELRIPEGGRNSHNAHVRDIHLTDRSQNDNLVERVNGTVRGRERPARGLKKADGPLTKGQTAYYNLLRPHQGLGGITPAEAAGLRLPKDGNRWAALIREALEARDS